VRPNRPRAASLQAADPQPHGVPDPSWVPLRSSSSDEEDGSSQPTLFEAALQCVSLPRRRAATPAAAV